MKPRDTGLYLFILIGTLLCVAAFSQESATLLKDSKVLSPNPSTAVYSMSHVCVVCIRAHEEFLASDVMQGRGSATHDEWVAAAYVASELRQYGIQPAGDDGGYIQRAPLRGRRVTSTPALSFDMSAAGISQTVSWKQGKEFLTVYLSDANFSGPLLKLDAADRNATITPGAVVLISRKNDAQVQRAALDAVNKGAVAELVVAPVDTEAKFAEAARQWPTFPLRLASEPGPNPSEHFNMLQLNKVAFNALLSTPDGTVLHFNAASEEQKTFTWNAVGILPGSDPNLRHSAVLLSAHLDHLGIGKAVNGDDIYNGADDDASGITAVLELARILGKGPLPRRTVIFALFGSEEIGGMGSTYFREHPPVPLKEIAANLEFEMIGRADPMVRTDTLWLTGWERSDLGPALAAHGAHLVADPHPEQNFFARSDNYILAKKGVVAQTVSSYGLHKDYHQPSDDLAHLDFKHMDAAIGSLLRPVQWLVNSDFTPKWNKGGQP